MNPAEVPNRERSKRAHFPRWLTPIYFALVLPLVLVVAPWGLSLLSPRYGWEAGHPGLLNLLSLILIVTGIACVIWIIVLHCVQAPEGWDLERTPRYLLIRGPYKFSRNPSYLSLLVIFFGWMLFYGSVAVFVAFVVAWAVLNHVAVPTEERDLEARFGEGYRQYKNTVRRWLGKTRG
jgi:protein-S-isoprenylcysteine O-methyltransferase Ste14